MQKAWWFGILRTNHSLVLVDVYDGRVKCCQLVTSNKHALSAKLSLIYVVVLFRKLATPYSRHFGCKYESFQTDTLFMEMKQIGTLYKTDKETQDGKLLVPTKIGGWWTLCSQTIQFSIFCHLAGSIQECNFASAARLCFHKYSAVCW